MRPRPFFQNPVTTVCPSNLFSFYKFRTLRTQWRLATPLQSIVSALLPMRWGVSLLSVYRSYSPLVYLELRGVAHQCPLSFQQLTNCSLFSPHCDFLCFHALTNCPICNLFVFITMQQYRGVWGRTGMRMKKLELTVRRKVGHPERAQRVEGSVGWLRG